MNFRTGFNFFKQATRMFKAPSVPFTQYPKNMQKIVNKALISQSSRAIQLMSMNHLLTIQNISQLLEKCQQKAMSDEVISSSNNLIFTVSAGNNMSQARHRNSDNMSQRIDDVVNR